MLPNDDNDNLTYRGVVGCRKQTKHQQTKREKRQQKVEDYLSNTTNLTWQNMLSCSYYFLMRVWQTQKVVAYDAQHLQCAYCVRWLLVRLLP
jgi:hypothetical protein